MKLEFYENFAIQKEKVLQFRRTEVYWADKMHKK